MKNNSQKSPVHFPGKQSFKREDSDGRVALESYLRHVINSHPLHHSMLSFFGINSVDCIATGYSLSVTKCEPYCAIGDLLHFFPECMQGYTDFDDLLLHLSENLGPFPPSLLHNIVFRGAPLIVLNFIISLNPDLLNSRNRDGLTPLGVALSLNFKSLMARDRVVIALMPHYLTSPRYFSFDPSLCGLQEAITSMIAPYWDSEALGQLHMSDEALAILKAHSRRAPSHASRIIFNKRYKYQQSLEASRFRELLGLWVDRVVRPLLYEHCDHVGEIIYQCMPTLRVQLAGSGALGAAHIDHTYQRQPTEVNVWLPLTTVDASNSLWAESAPGLKDYAPFEATYGTAVLFYGNQCSHYSVANTGNVTRVSLDFRVIREDLFIPSYVYPGKEWCNFKLGRHYTSTALEREWRAAGSQHESRHRHQDVRRVSPQAY